MVDDTDSVEPGPPYRVSEVAGHGPVGISDLVGATSVTVERSGHEDRLVGTGELDDEKVLFHEKVFGSAIDSEPVWTFTESGDGSIHRYRTQTPTRCHSSLSKLVE